MKNRMIPDEQEKVLLCYHCGNKTLMKRLARHGLEEPMFDIQGNELSGSFLYKEWNLYRCPVCMEVTLVHVWWDEFGDEWYLVDEMILYPAISINNKPIPENTRKRYEALLKVKNVDREQCIMGIRRVMESICKDKDAKGKDLKEKIIDLSNKGILPPKLGDMGHLLRVLGNSAAHADDVEFTDNIVNKAIDFISVILDYVYVIPNDIAILESEIEEMKNNANKMA